MARISRTHESRKASAGKDSESNASAPFDQRAIVRDYTPIRRFPLIRAKITALVLSVTLLGNIAPAAAQSSALTLPRVAHIASHALAVAVEDQNALAVEYGDPVVVSYRLGECNLETSHRAVCDYTVIESDGTVEDGALEVWTSKHIGVRWLDAEN